MSVTYDSFSNTMEQCFPVITGGAIAVAVSGGSDSIALLMMTKIWADQHGYEVVALHIDHNLRAESWQDAQFVEKISQKINVQCHILPWRHSGHMASNVQQEARLARYRLLYQWCNRHAVYDLLVGHHKDDQAETFMLRLERGSGVRGLACMKTITYCHKTRLLRPLLDISKCDLQQYLSDQQQNWQTDLSNYDDKYSRSYIRKLLTHGIPGSQISGTVLSERIYKTAKYMEKAQHTLDQIYTQVLVKYVFLYPQGFAKINPYILQDQDNARSALSEIIKIIGSGYYEPRSSSVQKLLLCLKQGSNVVHTLGHCKIKLIDHNIYIWKETKYIGNDIIISQPHHIWDKKFIFTFNNSWPKGNDYVITSLATINQTLDYDIPVFSYIPKIIHPSVPIIVNIKDHTIICPFQCDSIHITLQRYCKIQMMDMLSES